VTAHDRLHTIGWPSQRLPHAFTVTLTQPATPLPHPWILAGTRDTGHLICMPGVQKDWIDELVTDLTTARRAGQVPQPRRPFTAALTAAGEPA
jgi:histidine decarboxylase